MQGRETYKVNGTMIENVIQTADRRLLREGRLLMMSGMESME
jgi:hypothetical protein